jgi:hypothetical protein
MPTTRQMGAEVRRFPCRILGVEFALVGPSLIVFRDYDVIVARCTHVNSGSWILLT